MEDYQTNGALTYCCCNTFVEKPEAAVVPDEVRELMIRYDKAVKHYEIAG
jgi:hypothetical protein